jgi:dihydrodipicolinate synthase/N-acetylneuraminate lyase
LPDLFSLQAGTFYLQLASEPDRRRVLALIREHAKPEQRIFVGVIDPKTRNMFAEAEFANRDGRLRPGLFARVEAKLD